jgi:hypothetical protein
MRLCELMQRERASILALVADKLRRHHPGVAEPELRNELARFYDELVAALGGATRRHEAARPNLNDTSTTHGDQRHDLVFDPASIVHDYGIVCDSLYTVARRAGLAIDPVEAQTVNRLVDKAAADAITASGSATRRARASATTCGSAPWRTSCATRRTRPGWRSS